MGSCSVDKLFSLQFVAVDKKEKKCKFSTNTKSLQTELQKAKTPKKDKMDFFPLTFHMQRRASHFSFDACSSG